MGTPARRTRGSTKSAVAEPDVSSRGRREGGRANAALLPLTPSDGGIVAATETDGADRRLAAVGVAGDLTAVDAAWEFAAAGAARELAVPAVSGATDVDAGADAPPDLPLLLLLV